MPQELEIRPQEVSSTLEGWKRWLYAMLLISVMTLSSGKTVEAQDSQGLYEENPLVVVIPESVNVRSILPATVGQVVTVNGEATVLGYFDPGPDDQFGNRALEKWFVVQDQDGQIGAVASSLVKETDGSSLTPEEIIASVMPEYELEAGVPVAPVTPEPTATPTEQPSTVAGGNTGTSGNPEATATVASVEETDAPFTLESSQIPDIITANATFFIAATETLETVELSVPFNRESALSEFPLGLVDLEAYPALKAFADRIAPTLRGEHHAEVASVIFLGSSTGGGGRFDQHFSIPTRDGRFASFTITSSANDFAVFHLDENNQIADQNEIDHLTLVSAPARLRENALLLNQTPTTPGTQLLIIILDGKESGDTDEAQRKVNGGRNTAETIAEMQNNPEYQATNTYKGTLFKFQPRFYLSGFIVYE